ncbi:uncharacterized protein BDZ83DRAFT_624005 [Colletotrichum acutatum]|uniref:Uncharacterized protein n=1 Tax=Glomerella acutata TaxID=27357 RepID=A0AAD8UIU3_GLOAC|nr:uncharacterized protein BDZ83DRAFT_624005 [Colletotrichum acutatum]KAK1724053.1 hypothetical protein BDZ83DRAFT_624005 [Colletotrichum acutatum]
MVWVVCVFAYVFACFCCSLRSKESHHRMMVHGLCSLLPVRGAVAVFCRVFVL